MFQLSSLGRSLRVTAIFLFSLAALAQRPASAPGAALLKGFSGSYDADGLLRRPQIRAQLQRLLGSELAHLERNLDVKGSVDVIGGWLSVSGTAVHGGTVEEAAVCLSPSSLDVSAAILSDGTISAYSSLGGGTADVAGYESLPLCIKDWITQANSGHKDRLEQPRNVRMAAREP
jgi:hypothetical protein